MRTTPEGAASEPPAIVALALCAPLALSATLVFFGFVLGSLGGSWSLFAMGAVAGIGQWAMAERIWHRVDGMGSSDRVVIICLYLAASVLLLVVDELLFPL